MRRIEIHCPVCDDGKPHDAEVLEIKKGIFRRRTAEFEATVFIVRCLDCGTMGVVRKVESLGMESYEFPYED